MRASRILVSLVVVSAVAAFATSSLAANASVESSGRILKDGVPWFPLGIYHVSWIGDRQGAKAVGDLHAIADAGFDLVHATVDGRDDMITLFDAASARGVEMIAEIPWPEGGPGDFVNKWKSHPSIVGWNIRDDFNAPTFGPVAHPPAEVAARRDVIEGLDPNRLTYASGTPFPGATVAPYAGTMDVMGFQSYPIAEESYPAEYELEEAMDEFDYVRAQLAGTPQAWVANVQSYKWKSALGRYPTLREARNLLYAPLIRGANGILWYTMWEGSGTLLPSAAPALWADLSKQVAEVKSLRPFLLDGTLRVVPTGLERVHAGLWQLDHQVVVAVLNTHRTSSFAVSLPLPGPAYAAIAAMFPSRSESGMTVSAGNLEGEIGPEQVHVYILDETVAGNASPVATIAAAPAEVAYDQVRSFDASTSTDSDGTIAGCDWDFGDGSSATGVTANHSWASPGTYWTRLTVRDDGGATATAFAQTVVTRTSLCPSSPVAGCVAASGSLKLSIPAAADKRSLQWKWQEGSVASFGSPATTTEIALCLYDAVGRLLATSTRPDAAQWTDAGSAGLRFKDADASPSGIRSMKLQPGPGTARVQLKARGAHLDAVPLPLVPPVVVQLVGSDAPDCEETVFGSGDIARNGDGRFAASLR
ncbi:MAG: PKD domain-containing protein [Candidatus Binatia bacterium]